MGEGGRVVEQEAVLTEEDLGKQAEILTVDFVVLAVDFEDRDLPSAVNLAARGLPGRAWKNVNRA